METPIQMQSPWHPGPWGWLKPSYFQEDAELRLGSFAQIAGTIVTVRGLWLNVDGQLGRFSFTQSPTSGSTENVTNFPLGAGWLVHAIVQVTTGTPLKGQLFVSLRIVQNPNSVAFQETTLAHGYLTSGVTVAYPHLDPMTPIDGAGALRSINVTSPAAGAEWTMTVPAGVRRIVRTIAAKLVTAVAAATRQVQIVVDDGTTTLWTFTATDTQIASLTRFYEVHPQGYAQAAFSTNIYIQGELPLPLAAGFRISSLTTSIQAADQWSVVQMLVEDYVEA